MKKLVLMAGALALSATAMAHTQYLYTDTLDVSGKKEVKIKTLFGHPGEGREVGGVAVGTVDGKALPVKEFYMIHNGEKKDFTAKVTDGVIKTDKNTVRTLDYIFTPEDGLKGQGSFIFVMIPNHATDEGYTFFGAPKLIIAKDGAGADWDKRVAPGYPEIIPLKHPADLWTEDVFVAKFVDKDGNPVKHARIDVDFINAKIDVMNDTYRGGDPKMPEVSKRTYTDDNGMFYFSAPRAGMYAIRGVESMDRANKVVHDTGLVVQFK